MVGRFLLLSLVFFAVLFYPWRAVAPYYKAAVARMTTALQALSDSEKFVSYNENAEKFQIGHQAFPGVEMEFTGESLHYNMIIMAAMILASPGLLWRRRLKYLAAGVAIAFCLHSIQVYVKAEDTFARKVLLYQNSGSQESPAVVGLIQYSKDHYSALQRQFYEIATQFFDVFGQQLLPFAIWALLCVPAVLAFARQAAPQASPAPTQAAPPKPRRKKA